MTCNCGRNHNGTYGSECEDCWSDRQHTEPDPDSEMNVKTLDLVLWLEPSLVAA